MLAVVLFSTISFVSCDKDKTYNPITLSYDADGIVFDNQTRLISVPLFGKSLPILINGGDGDFSITNDSEFVDCALDGKTLIIYAISPGTGSVVIKDNSHNSYTLQVTVSNKEVASAKVSSYPIVRGVGMEASRKAALERQIVADAPTGIWQFVNVYIQVGIPFIARQYLTNAENSEYKEYTAVLQEKNQHGQTAPAQVVSCFLMKSDTEEFMLYICQPFYLDNGKLIRGYNFVKEVTSRYIAEYSEITHAFEVQSYLDQKD